MKRYQINTQKLIDFRKARNLTQSDLAKIVGVTTGQICHYETGLSKLGIRMLIKIGKALGFAIQELIIKNEREGRGEEE